MVNRRLCTRRTGSVWPKHSTRDGKDTVGAGSRSRLASSMATAHAASPIGPMAATNESSSSGRVSLRTEREDRQAYPTSATGRVNLTSGLGPMMTKYYWTGAPLSFLTW
jgi:hypothetical protein